MSPVLATLAQQTLESSDLPAWHPHPDVWVIIGTLAVGYLYAVHRIGRHLAPDGEPPATAFQQTSFLLGLGLLATVSLWPFHDIGDDYLFSFHMVDHLVVAFAVPPLLLLGTPRWMARAVLDHPFVLGFARSITQPVAAFFIFNLVLVGLHWPPVINAMAESAVLHFVVHTSILVAGLIMWMPVLSPLPEIPQLSRPGKMLYLFAQSLLPTVPASFLTFGREPMYRVYAEAPRLWGIDAVTDQTVAGLIMKIGGGFFLWTVIAVIFFRWYAEEQRWERIERQLRRS